MSQPAPSASAPPAAPDAPTAAVAALAVMPAFAVGLPPLAGSLHAGAAIGLPLDPLRWLLLPALAIAVALAVRYRDAPRVLIAVTLLLAVTVPASRLGAPAPNALPVVTALPLTAGALEADAAAIAALRERAGSPAGRLPGAPPPPQALQAALAPARTAVLAAQAAQAAWLAQRDALARQIDTRRGQIAELQSAADRGSMLARAIGAARVLELQNTISQLQEAARPGLDHARERAELTRAEAIARVTELRIGLDREHRLVMRHDAALRGGPYLLAALATLAWLLWRVPFAGPCFAALAAGALALALGAAWGGSTDGRTARVVLALHALLGAVLAALLLRVAARTLQDNRELRAAIGRPQWRRALLRAAWVWSPAAAALAALHLLLGAAALEAALARIGCVGGDAVCRGALMRRPDPAPDMLPTDLRAALDRLIAQAEARTVAAVEAVPVRAPGGTTLALAAAATALERQLPRRLADLDPRLRTDGCGLVDATCHVAALLAGLLERAYAAPRDALLASVAAPGALAGSAPGTTTSGPGTADRPDAEPSPTQRLRAHFASASRSAHAQLDAGIAALSSWFVLKGALLLLIALRSFLHVLSRTLFAEDRGAYATMTPNERSAGEGIVLTVTEGSRLELDLDGRTLYVRRSVDVDDAAPETALLPPQPLCAALARLRSGCWLLKRIDGGAPDHGPRRVALQAAQGAQFVLWHLPPQGEVAFRWDRFVAMTGGLALSRTVSAKLSRLATGQVALHTARGPGLLVLRSHGAPATAPVSVAPERLLGWPLGTRFRIESSRAFASAWIDPCQVRAAEPGAAVIDAPRDRSGGSGALRDAGRMFGG